MNYSIKITDLVTGNKVIEFDMVDSHDLTGDVLNMTGRYMNDTTVKMAPGWMIQIGDR